MIPKSLYLLLVFFVRATECDPQSKSLSAVFESLWNLNEMAECKLHYTAFNYNDYGCWCGVGGSGEPVDGIDACCMAHDKCYDAAVDQKICPDVPVEYLDNYDWDCIDGEPVCADTLTGCKQALCNCDKHVVDCWSRYPKPLSKKKCTRTQSFWNWMATLFKTFAHLIASIPHIIASLFFH